MPLYDLPKFSFGFQGSNPLKNFFKNIRERDTVRMLVTGVVISVLFGFIGGGITGGYVYYKLNAQLGKMQSQFSEREPVVQKETVREYIPQTSQEERIIEVVERVSPAVVSIVITKDVPIIEQFFTNPFEEFFGPSPFEFQIPQFRQKGVEKKKVGGGSGFIVSSDGLVVTNKHVVLDENAEYTVFTNDGKSYPAKVLAKDPFQDLAILKIDQSKFTDQGGNFSGKPFSSVTLGDSDSVEIGQTVIAIGNALGEFRNTVSVGVISGLGRTITASDGRNFVETIEDVIQTDAAINQGNSGGPLLNLAGEVIGINTATVLEAQNIGFAIPINKVKRDIVQVETIGKIVYPFLGVRYVLITEQVAKERNLPVTYGALVLGGSQGEPGVTPGSAAAHAGVKENDIILEFNGEKITQENSLGKLIQKYNPGDAVTLKILRNKKEITLTATLGERSE